MKSHSELSGLTSVGIIFYLYLNAFSSAKSVQPLKREWTQSRMPFHERPLTIIIWIFFGFEFMLGFGPGTRQIHIFHPVKSIIRVRSSWDGPEFNFLLRVSLLVDHGCCLDVFHHLISIRMNHKTPTFFQMTFKTYTRYEVNGVIQPNINKE